MSGKGTNGGGRFGNVRISVFSVRDEACCLCMFFHIRLTFLVTVDNSTLF